MTLLLDTGFEIFIWDGKVECSHLATAGAFPPHPTLSLRVRS